MYLGKSKTEFNWRNLHRILATLYGITTGILATAVFACAEVCVLPSALYCMTVSSPQTILWHAHQAGHFLSSSLSTMISRATSIPWHDDFHAVPWNSPFATEFAACCGKMWNYPFFATFISNSRFLWLLLVPEMVYYVSRGTLNSAHSLNSLTPFLILLFIKQNLLLSYGSVLSPLRQSLP